MSNRTIEQVEQRWLEVPPAFPATVRTQEGEITHSGLSKREWFAGMAMSGLITDDYLVTPEKWADNLAKAAVEYADALITALAAGEKDTPNG